MIVKTYLCRRNFDIVSLQALINGPYDIPILSLPKWRGDSLHASWVGMHGLRSNDRASSRETHGPRERYHMPEAVMHTLGPSSFSPPSIGLALRYCLLLPVVSLRLSRGNFELLNRANQVNKGPRLPRLRRVSACCL